MKLKIGNFKGPKGDTGAKGDKGNKGDRGEPGLRGSRWTSGTGITGTSTVGTKFPSSGITDAQSYDYYVNTDTGNLYECKVAGTADVAEWAYIGSFKGPKGDAGPAGSISDINSQKPTYSEAAELKNIESGETVQESFGKIKKAISVLISHYAQKATQSILGHVKLSDSSAITISGEYALDAIEKNASVAGTLANMISQANSNFKTYQLTPNTEYIDNSYDVRIEIIKFSSRIVFARIMGAIHTIKPVPAGTTLFTAEDLDFTTQVSYAMFVAGEVFTYLYFLQGGIIKNGGAISSNDSWWTVPGAFFMVL